MFSSFFVNFSVAPIHQSFIYCIANTPSDDILHFAH
jgi:hypothetical protein